MHTTKKPRPNYEAMSLTARFLQSAGLPNDGDDTKARTKPVDRFRLVFIQGPDSEGKFGDRLYKEVFNEALKDLQTQVLLDAFIVVTAMSNSADKLLVKYFLAELGRSDEVASSTERETLTM